jgi:hypothetical protein
MGEGGRGMETRLFREAGFPGTQRGLKGFCHPPAAISRIFAGKLNDCRSGRNGLIGCKGRQRVGVVYSLRHFSQQRLSRI